MSRSARDSKAPNRRRRGDLLPDPEMWAALEHGHKLTQVLQDFYARAFADPRLSPFFRGVTLQRVIEKQYSFMRQIFTGERIYFGDRPRNAHHWMVISDALFDYREELMAESLRRAGLPDHLIARWRTIDEVFRKQIVKHEPIPKRVRGIDLPLDGYAPIVLAVGACCDGCQAILDEGTHVHYHQRTGQTYCKQCVNDLQAARAGRGGR